MSVAIGVVDAGTDARAEGGVVRGVAALVLRDYPDPVSFNKCPAAMNNAGLAFDRTYTEIIR